MKWIEVIQLRSVNCDRESLKTELQKLVNEVEKEKKKQAIKIYNRALLSTDFCIQIVHDSNNAENCGSPLGLRLVSALKDFGLVNHSIWIEMADK